MKKSVGYTYWKVVESTGLEFSSVSVWGVPDFDALGTRYVSKDTAMRVRDVVTHACERLDMADYLPLRVVKVRVNGGGE